MAEKNTVVLKGRITANRLNWKNEKISTVTFQREERLLETDRPITLNIDFELDGWFTIGASVKATFEVK